MSEPGSRQDWSQSARSHALSQHPLVLEEAKDNSAHFADVPFLMGLAREIAIARGPELTSAYRNVAMVQPGFKKVGSGLDEALVKQPCVVFVVSKKWAASATKHDDAQHIPRWLVTFAEHRGRRMPFAVPTDVQDSRGFNKARAHSAHSVWLQPPGVGREHGAVTCAVRLSSVEGTSLCLLSAQHVFTPCADVSALQVQGDVEAKPLDASGNPVNQPVVALSIVAGGVLRGEEDPLKPSFDVQLARLKDDEEGRRVVGAGRLHSAEPWVRSPERLWELGATRWFELLVPDDNPPLKRGPLQAELDAPMALPFPLVYRVRRGTSLARVKIYHDELVKLKITAPSHAHAGDSGCAVVVRQSDDSFTLVGMYIGGDGDRAYMIPAWQLFDMKRWWQHPDGARVKPVSI